MKVCAGSGRLALLFLAVDVVACSSGAARDEAEMAAMEARPRDLCAVARDADFDPAGEAELSRYLVGLAQSEDPGTADRVSLAIVRGEPKPGPIGMTAGEVACRRDSWRITLYRDALVGRQLFEAYRTVAHEFRHVVQIRREGLPCKPTHEAQDRLEAEAAAFAEARVSACGAVAPAAGQP
jgi:hypothetical protein